MTELNEGIAALLGFMEDDEKCEYQPQKGWKCNLNGSSSALATQMGNKPTTTTKESALSATCWPSQAHHLVPHIQLKAHAVAKWLKTGPSIYADTQYNVDHKNNGKWMPYASDMDTWKKKPTQRRSLMFKIMRLSGIQMHQGPHSRRNKYGIGATPYKERVNEYLELIREDAVSHYVGPPECKDCKGKKQAKKYPPRNNTVKYVDAASELLEHDINDCLIFVSRIAAEFALAGGFA